VELHGDGFSLGFCWT